MGVSTLSAGLNSGDDAFDAAPASGAVPKPLEATDLAKVSSNVEYDLLRTCPKEESQRSIIARFMASKPEKWECGNFCAVIVTVTHSGELDRYRRSLGWLSFDDKSDVGAILLQEGLALKWKPGGKAKAARIAHWCGAAALGRRGISHPSNSGGQ